MKKRFLSLVNDLKHFIVFVAVVILHKTAALFCYLTLKAHKVEQALMSYLEANQFKR